jgi:hypothetical protein
MIEFGQFEKWFSQWDAKDLNSRLFRYKTDFHKEFIIKYIVNFSFRFACFQLSIKRNYYLEYSDENGTYKRRTS